MRLTFAGLLLLVLVLAVLMTRATVATSSPSSDFSIVVAPGTISVGITLNIRQNLTAFRSSFSFPLFQAVLEGSNATLATQSLQSAVASKNPLARIEGLRLDAQTTPWSNMTSMQWLNVTMNFNVSGVSSTGGGVSHTDLSWKSFAASSDLAVNGFELNNIGARDLQAIAHDLAQQKGNAVIAFSYRIDGIPVNAAFFPDVVARISPMNFSRLATPVAQWKQAYVPLAPTLVWTSPPTPLLGLTFVRTITEEPTNPVSTYFGVFYTLQGEITLPTTASVSGDTVTLAPNGLPETLMGITIISSIVIGSGALIYERRLSPSKAKGYMGRKKAKR